MQLGLQRHSQFLGETETAMQSKVVSQHTVVSNKKSRMVFLLKYTPKLRSSGEVSVKYIMDTALR